MKAEINGNDLVITVPILPPGKKESKTGKSWILAETDEITAKTELLYQDKPVTINLKAYYSKK